MYENYLLCKWDRNWRRNVIEEARLHQSINYQSKRSSLKIRNKTRRKLLKKIKLGNEWTEWKEFSGSWWPPDGFQVKRNDLNLSLSLSVSLTVRGTHSRQLQTPYVRTGLVPNSLELFQVRWACTEARLPVLIRRVRISCGRIPLAMRACLERGIIRDAEYRATTRIFELYRVRFPVKKESNGC